MTKKPFGKILERLFISVRFSCPCHCGDLYLFFFQEYESCIEIACDFRLSDAPHLFFPGHDMYNQIYGVLFLSVEPVFFFQECKMNI